MSKLKQMIFCALFAALTAILSQIAVPIGAIPINMVHISIFVASGILGGKYATISQVIFLILGIIGIPVFSGFNSGLGYLTGPTGGFIMGYISCAWIVGEGISKVGIKSNLSILIMVAGLASSYMLGVSWFMYVTEADIITALLTCVFPFLLGDAVKVIISRYIILRLHSLNNVPSYANPLIN